MNIYVGNLPFSISEDEVREAFSAYGQVASVSIIKDKFTGESRGFAFVEMPNGNEAQAAISAMNGQAFRGRTLTVNEARPRTDDGGRGRGGGDRGGFGGGQRRGGGDRGGYGDRRGGGGGGERRGGGSGRRDW